jgi:hypothetical protein
MLPLRILAAFFLLGTGLLADAVAADKQSTVVVGAHVVPDDLKDARKGAAIDFAAVKNGGGSVDCARNLMADLFAGHELMVNGVRNAGDAAIDTLQTARLNSNATCLDIRVHPGVADSDMKWLDDHLPGTFSYTHYSYPQTANEKQ